MRLPTVLGYLVSLALLVLSVALHLWMLWPLGGLVFILIYFAIDDWWVRKRFESDNEGPPLHRTPNLWVPVIVVYLCLGALIYRAFDPAFWPSLLSMMLASAVAYATFRKL